jgi:phytol kinase
MILVVGILFLIYGLLVLNEILWRKKIIHGELARKPMHIIVGTFGAFWPFFMSWNQIAIISFVSVLATLFIRKSGKFKSVYDINRHSWGDLIGPTTIGAIALLEPSKWVFVAAVLHIALADGLAALIGARYGKNNKYKVFGHTKSVAGTLAFWVVSFSILAWLVAFGPLEFNGLSLAIILWLPLVAAAFENMSPFGSDNFFVPVLIVGVLGYTQFVF